MSITTSTGATRGNRLVSGGAGAALAFNEILKEFYEPAVVDQLNSKTVLSRLIPRRREEVSGKYSVHSLRTGRNFGYGYAGENGRLPDPQAQQHATARFNMRYSYGRIRFSGPAASASRNDRGSFIRMMDEEVQGLAQDIQVNDNRIMFGDGSGRLAQIASGSGSGPWTLTNPGGITSTALGTQYISRQMRVATMATDTAATSVGTAPGTLFNGSTVKAAFINVVDPTAGTVTFMTNTGAASTLAGLSGNQYLYIVNDYASDTDGLSWGRGLEPHGLAAIVDDADPVFMDGAAGNWPAGFGELPIASNPVWRAPVIDNGGTAIPFNPDFFQQAMDLLDQTSDGSVDTWVTTHGIRRQYLNSLVAAKRYNTMELDGGFTALHWNGRPIVVDKDCTRGRIYGLSLQSLFIEYENDYHWMDDGAILRRLENQDAYQGTMMRYWNMGTDARNRNVLIADIVDN